MVAVVAAGALACGIAPAEAESQIRVGYRGSRISVEATDAALPDVLRAMGKHAGFRVVDSGAARPPITITIGPTPLEDALARLLRHEGHVLVYGPSAKGTRIEAVILRGPSGVAGPAPPPAAIVPVEPPARSVSSPAAPRPVAPAPSTAGSGVARQAPPAARRTAVQQPAPADGTRPEESAAPNVGSMLESQALATRGGPPSAPAAPPPADPDEALAQATRNAVQGVRTLVDQLSVATDGLTASPPPQAPRTRTRPRN